MIDFIWRMLFEAGVRSIDRVNRKIPHVMKHEIASGAWILEEYLPFLERWARGGIK
jgi:hypothetical protein